MLGKLVWQVTGDEILFSVTFPELFEYWLDQLNCSRVNSFHCDNPPSIVELTDRLKSNLEKIQKISSRIPLEIDDWHGEILDQNYLNKVHRQWVQTGLKYPNLPTMLEKLNGLDIDFREINSNLHKLERAFVYKFLNYTHDPYQVENIFGSKIINFDKSNIELGFDNLGRSSWDKFAYFDNNACDTDTNNFEMLSGKVTVNLNRPLSGAPPVEYVNWCQNHKVAVIGNSISLGNIVDLESKIFELRKILIRNTYESSNKFFFEICS